MRRRPLVTAAGTAITTQRGFTLAELLVACAVVGVIMSGTLVLLQQGQFTYLWGAARVETQQTARWAADLMTRELRTAQSLTTTAGCDVGATALTFVDENGATIQYNLNGTTLERHVNGSTGPNDIMTGSIRNISFTCYRSDSTATATPANVRMIVIAVTTTPEGSAALPASSPSLQSTYLRSKVTLRNM